MANDLDIGVLTVGDSSNTEQFGNNFTSDSDFALVTDADGIITATFDYAVTPDDRTD